MFFYLCTCGTSIARLAQLGVRAACECMQVNQGLFKMYQVELLSKFPIMQHSLWGSLIPFPGT